MEKWLIEACRLEQLALIVHRDENGTTPVIIDVNLQTVLISDDHDVGCLVLNQQEFERFLELGGIALDPDMLTEMNHIPEMCILAGHCSARSRTRQEVISTDESAGKAWELITLTNVTIGLLKVADIESGDQPGTIRYSPVNQNLETYEGMSGGPVFGFSRGAENLEIQIIAIQSKQITKGNTVVSLIGTRGDVALNEAVQLVNEFDSPNGGT